jgi:hypothetical protein
MGSPQLGGVYAGRDIAKREALDVYGPLSGSVGFLGDAG